MATSNNESTRRVGVGAPSRAQIIGMPIAPKTKPRRPVKVSEALLFFLFSHSLIFSFHQDFACRAVGVAEDVDALLRLAEFLAIKRVPSLFNVQW